MWQLYLEICSNNLNLNLGFMVFKTLCPEYTFHRLGEKKVVLKMVKAYKKFKIYCLNTFF